MRILYLLQDFPLPLTDGMRFKTFNLLQHVAPRHQCDLLCFGEPSPADLAGLEKELPAVRLLGTFSSLTGGRLLWQRLWNVSRRVPFSVSWWTSTPFRQAVAETLRDNAYDVVHLDMISMSQYQDLVAHLPHVLSLNDPTVLSRQRALSEAPRFRDKVAAGLALRQFHRYEPIRCTRADKVHLVNFTEVQWMRTELGLENVVAIPLAVGDEFRVPAAPSATAENNLQLFYSGLLRPELADTWRPLLAFVEGGFQTLRERFPGLSLALLGRAADRRLAERLAAAPGVRFEHWVEDYVGALNEAGVVIFPDASGCGMKTRVLQAMAMGKAVVGTTRAFGGIEVTDRVHGIVADDHDSFTAGVAAVLGNADLRRDLGRNAQQLIAARHSIPATGTQWENLYREAIETHRRRGLSKPQRSQRTSERR